MDDWLASLKIVLSVPVGLPSLLGQMLEEAQYDYDDDENDEKLQSPGKKSCAEGQQLDEQVERDNKHDDDDKGLNNTLQVHRSGGGKYAERWGLAVFGKGAVQVALVRIFFS